MSLEHTNVEIFDFYVDEDPIDLNLRYLDGIGTGPCAYDFERLLLDERVISDPSGSV